MSGAEFFAEVIFDFWLIGLGSEEVFVGAIDAEFRDFVFEEGGLPLVVDFFYDDFRADDVEAGYGGVIGCWAWVEFLDEFRGGDDASFGCAKGASDIGIVTFCEGGKVVIDDGNFKSGLWVKALELNCKAFRDISCSYSWGIEGLNELKSFFNGLIGQTSAVGDLLWRGL